MRLYQLMRWRSAMKSGPSIGMVAVNPRGGFHFHTGRPLARRLGYDEDVIARMPETAIEAFAGVGNPFSQGALHPGERVVDLGSGGGFDCFVAAGQVGPEGRVVGVDMTDEMLERLPCSGDGAGPRPCRVPKGDHRGTAGRERLGRCRHQQRRHQPLRRQASCLQRGYASVAPRWTVAVRRHRHGQGCAGSGCSKHRSVD